MQYRLAPGIVIAAIDDRVVILDRRRDRYKLIAGRLAATIRDVARHGEGTDSAALAALEARKFIEPGLFRDEPSRGQPANGSALEVPGPVAIIRHATIAAAVLRARLLIRWRGFSAALERRDGEPCDTLSIDEINAIAKGFSERRPSIPLPRGCLHDSLALRSILAACQQPVALHIGVRLDPFVAHAWLQHDGTVLNDHLEAVTPYTVIVRA